MSAPSDAARVLIGIVGYTPILRSYPLGPELMARLQAEAWPGVSATVENMSWGPVHIVQAFQASDVTYDRVVLVAAVDRGGAPGTILCGHWQGGELGALDMQDRMYEAVTGCVSLDNLLIIGEHFGIWPDEVITVEIELPETCFGDLVIAEFERGGRGEEIDADLADRFAFRTQDVIDRTVHLARRAALEGIAGGLTLEPRTAATLNPTARFWQAEFVHGEGSRGGAN